MILIFWLHVPLFLNHPPPNTPLLLKEKALKYSYLVFPFPPLSSSISSPAFFPTSQNAVPSMHLGTNMPSWAPLPLSTAQTFKRNNTTISGSISSANISDEGQYTCDLFVPANGASIPFCMWLVSVWDTSTYVAIQLYRYCNSGFLYIGKLWIVHWTWSILMP